MRIIAGSLGGRILKTVEGEGYRPAMGRTREALFSMLEARGLEWEQARVLDLFAGSGSLAFESISRGAAEALLVENAAPAAKCLARNVEALGVADRVRLFKDDVLQFLRRQPPQPCDLVFLDPPYRKNLAASALTGLVVRGWLAEQALVCAELEKEAPIPQADGLDPIAERLFGQTRIIIWNHA